MINYRKSKTKVLASKYSLYIGFSEEEAFKKKALDWLPYREEIEKYKKRSMKSVLVLCCYSA